MAFTKKEEIAIMKALHRIMSKLKVEDLKIYWALANGVKKRGGEFD